MAEVVANKLAEEVVCSLLTKVKKEIGYMWNSKENVDKLKREAENLKNMKERVEQKIKLAREKGDELLAGVEKWVNEADAQISTTEDFIQEEAHAKKTCFNLRMCVNLSTLHHYGKEAINKVPFLEQHQKEGEKFEQGNVYIDTHVPRNIELFERKKIDELETHKSLLDKITQSVLDENLRIIGLYGIGGVGKTTLAKEVAAKFKDDRESFSHVEFVVVAHRVDAEIKKDVEVAAKRIMNDEKVLIILDDVWRELNLEHIGIPCGTNHQQNYKILLTSRKRSVCRDMNAKQIGVDTLPVEEAWILFKSVVGERVETDAKLKPIAMKVVKGCGGLPLILKAVGKALKDEENFEEWKRALYNIEKHATSDIDPSIKLAFANLRLSYDYLESEEAKSIFLLCSLFPEDFNIPLERLTYYCVGLEVFKDLSTLEDARNKVQGAVKILKSSCLLLDGFDESTTKMHDVVREVALLIASNDDNKYLVEAGKCKTEWEPRIGSLESYTGISLIRNDISELPAGYELNMPLLKIFLIQNNRILSELPDDFTHAIKNAEVLDLQKNDIKSLPNSLKQLTGLRMLNLKNNKLVCDVSILGGLKQLKILILSKTGITEIPQEIGKLVNLRLFHALRCPGLSHIAPGVLSNLRWLEELHIGYYPQDEGDDTSLLEIGELSKLTFLNLYVPHIHLIPKCDYLKRLNRFVIQSGLDANASDLITQSRFLILNTHHFINDSNLMHVRKMIDVCNGICICIPNLDYTTTMMCCDSFGLKSVTFAGCSDLLSLVDKRVLDEMQPSETHEVVKKKKRFLSEVEELRLVRLDSLKVIWNCPDQYISLNNLVTCEIIDCPKLEKLFTVSVAQGLVNLKRLWIFKCGSLKEVISDGDEETSTGEIDTVVPATNIVFPRLAEIDLNNLHSLTSFYPGNATIKYPSLEKVWISDCDEMGKWGYGTHDTPNLQRVNKTKANGSTIHDTFAKDRELNML